MIEACRRGHPRTPTNTRYYLRSTGATYRTCLICKSLTNLLWAKSQYRHNPTFRDRKKASSLTYYHTHYRADPDYRTRVLLRQEAYRQSEKALK